MSDPRDGDLRVWWIPQMPMNVKPDYSNAGGLEVFERTGQAGEPGGEWCDWSNPSGEDIKEWTARHISGGYELGEKLKAVAAWRERMGSDG